LKDGIVRTFDADKGYGWIVPSDGGNLLVRKCSIAGHVTTLPSDARVTYELRRIGKGVEAIKVTLSK
jgi:cold shock CspA family protein